MEDIIPYPEFAEYHNDIALLRLPRDMRLARLSPACLPVTPDTVAESFLNVRCVATGWGHTSHDEAQLQDDLHEVDLRVTSWEECAEVYAGAYNITLQDYHLCASPEVEGRGTCVVSQVRKEA